MAVNGDFSTLKVVNPNQIESSIAGNNGGHKVVISNLDQIKLLIQTIAEQNDPKNLEKYEIKLLLPDLKSSLSSSSMSSYIRTFQPSADVRRNSWDT